MKNSKLFTAFLIVMTGLQIANAQDTLIFPKGIVLSVSIIKENSSEIYFNKTEDKDSAVYRVDKSDLKKICYRNGEVNIFKYDDDSVSVSGMTGHDLYGCGKSDARKFYHNKGAGTGVLLTTIFLTPLVGIFPAAACSQTEPKLSHKDFPSIPLKNDPDYIKGYTQEARKIKQKIVWRNFRIGLGVNVVLLGILTIAWTNQDPWSPLWFAN